MHDRSFLFLLPVSSPLSSPSLQQAVAIINSIPVEKLARLLLRVLATLHTRVSCIAWTPHTHTHTHTHTLSLSLSLSLSVHDIQIDSFTLSKFAYGEDCRADAMSSFSSLQVPSPGARFAVRGRYHDLQHTMHIYVYMIMLPSWMYK